MGLIIIFLPKERKAFEMTFWTGRPDWKWYATWAEKSAANPTQIARLIMETASRPIPKNGMVPITPTSTDTMQRETRPAVQILRFLGSRAKVTTNTAATDSRTIWRVLGTT